MFFSMFRGGNYAAVFTKGMWSIGLSVADYIVLFAGVVIMFVVSLLERRCPVRERKLRSAAFTGKYDLMEIKINRAVPLWFTRILSELEIYPVSFSKYGTDIKNMLWKIKE